MGELVMNAEKLALLILTGITILGFMVALNAKGITRLSISFLMATLLLALNVVGVVQYLNNPTPEKTESNTQTIAEQERLMLEQQIAEKQQAEAAEKEKQKRIENQRNKEKEAVKIASFLRESSDIAAKLRTVQLHDFTLEYSQLVARAQQVYSSVLKKEEELGKMTVGIAYYKSVTSDMKTSLEALKKAAKYYKLYYKANDEQQERVRENIIRSSAKEAQNGFDRVLKIVNSGE